MNYLGYYYKKHKIKDGVLFIEKGTKDIDANIVNACEFINRGKIITKIVIPNSVKKISKGAFSGYKKVKKIILSNENRFIRVRSIEEICPSLSLLANYARKIEIPLSLEEIEEEAFNKCEYLEKIELPEGLRKIGKRAFSECYRLKEVKIPSSIEEIDKEVFSECWDLEEIELPEGLRKIGERAFSGCKNLNKIKIPSSVEEISYSAFEGCDNLRYIYVEKDSYAKYYFLDVLGSFELNNIELIESSVGDMDKESLEEKVDASEKEAIDVNFSASRIRAIKKMGESGYPSDVIAIEFNCTIEEVKFVLNLK